MTDQKTENGLVEGDSSYGGLEGAEAKYIELISNDGYEFVIKREYAMISGTIKAMLTGPGEFAENETNKINFKDIPSYILAKACMYFAYKHCYEHSLKEAPVFTIDPKIALDLLMAANFLDC